MILQISSTQLSRGIPSDDVARVQQVLQALGRGVPADETADRGLSAGTVAVVKGLQTELGWQFPASTIPGFFKAIHDKHAKHRKLGEHLQ